MFKIVGVVIVGLSAALTGCQKFDESSLVCEKQWFVTRGDYYSCCKVRELIYVRQLLERVDVEQCSECESYSVK